MANERPRTAPLGSRGHRRDEIVLGERFGTCPALFCCPSSGFRPQVPRSRQERSGGKGPHKLGTLILRAGWATAVARRLTLELREGVERLEATSSEAGVVGHGGDHQALSRQLREKQKELQRVSAEMDSVWRMQVVREGASKKDMWKRKVEQIGEESDSLRMALDKFSSREIRKQAEEKERSELLRRVAVDDDDPVASGKRDFDVEAQAMASVDNSHRLLDEAFSVGSDVLAAMGGQRERLKSAHRKALDVLNNIGISDSLMRVVERRQKVDQAIVVAGCLVTTAVTGLVWFWTK